jgi:hypothetical protein
MNLFFLHIFWFLSFSCQASLPPGLSWNMASSGESHGATCSRLGLLTTSTRITLGDIWNYTTILKVVNEMGTNPGDYTLLQEAPLGCCAPGLWCSIVTQQCFTQSFGNAFENVGWLSGSVGVSDFRPIFTCAVGNIEFYSGSTSTGSTPYVIDFEEEGVMGKGKLTFRQTDASLGYDNGAVAPYFGTQQCSQTELCTPLCRTCDPDEGRFCDHDSICVTYQTGSQV